MNAIQTVENALKLTLARLKSAPDFDIFISTFNQLEYLLSVLKGDESDRSRLKNIIVGHFAVREFQESDPEFSDALTAAQLIAFKMSKGLKF